MRLTIVLAVFLLAMPAWAGTFKDDFEDGNWAGWSINGVDEASIVNGVLRLDHIDKSGSTLAISTGTGWGDYSFSADMRLVKTEPGATH